MMREDENEELEGISISGSKILRLSAILAVALIAAYFVFFQIF